MTERDNFPESPVAEKPALSYATPGAKTASAGPGVALIFGALGLIFLGGCFLIGVMDINSLAGGFGPAPVTPLPKAAGQIVLEIVLYLIAFCCFAGALFLFVTAIRWLRKLVV